ncbi:MAG: hypothetical protein E7263_08155 [Lachnospiraceae bacterium]|nr:hypothetical protein [Lachnospiraceae bacterium]
MRISKRLFAVLVILALVITGFSSMNGVVVAEAATTPSVKYKVHRQTYGWENSYKSDGAVSGTVGEGKRLESIVIDVEGSGLGVSYRTHVQSYGWLDWSTDGKLNGTEGEAKRLEAIQIKLTGANSSKYDIYYRVHAQTYGWLGWAKNGEPAGTAGQGKRLEAIQIVIVPSGYYPEDYGYEGSLGCAYVDIAKTYSNVSENTKIEYMTHVQSYGDQVWVSDGSIAGTSGEAKRLERIRIVVNNGNVESLDGGVMYKTHVQSYGWQDWSYDGEASGTAGEGKRLEAIQIKLYGELNNYYDVYYRVHAQSYGWLNWVKNGESSGTAGMGKRLEAIQIVLVPKYYQAPNSLPAKPGTAGFVEKKTISKDQAYKAVYNYLDEKHSITDWLGNYGSYILTSDLSNGEYKVTFRSYTGAFQYHYVNANTGKVRITEYVPGIINVETDTGVTYNAWDYVQ